MSASLLTILDNLSEAIFVSAHCMVMHSDVIVFCFVKRSLIGRIIVLRFTVNWSFSELFFLISPEKTVELER